VGELDCSSIALRFKSAVMLCPVCCASNLAVDLLAAQIVDVRSGRKIKVGPPKARDIRSTVYIRYKHWHLEIRMGCSYY
jgi:hypothetical protein